MAKRGRRLLVEECLYERTPLTCISSNNCFLRLAIHSELDSTHGRQYTKVIFGVTDGVMAFLGGVQDG